MKRLLALLASALILSGAAFAAEGPDPETSPPPETVPDIYPVEVVETQAGDYRRIEKVYLLESGTDPAAIPTLDFQREGYGYALLDLLREDQTETETREHTETVTIDSETKDMSAILEKLEASMELTTDDGFTGTLDLDPKSITVEAAGYQSSTRTVSAIRTYPGLSDADTALLPKSTVENGRTLELADVSWQTVPGGNDTLPPTYTATAVYSGTASSRSATGYTVTASYTGELTCTVSGAVRYTAVFAGAPLEPLEEAAQDISETPAQLAVHYGLPALAVASALVLAGLGLHHLIKWRNGRRYAA